MNKNLYNELKSYPLSNYDLQAILHPDTKIHGYEQLFKIKHIDELMDNKGRFILLYRLSTSYGHWTGIIKKDNHIEFFDPYGFPPDTQHKNLEIEKDMIELYKQDQNKLVNLINDAGYYITYSHKKLQDIKNYDIATCGRHVASRLIFYKLTLGQYYELMDGLNKNKDADKAVTELTYEIINK